MPSRSVFISYAHVDRDAVHRAADLLRAGGVQVFVDVVDIDFGERWKDVLAQALAKCERVMVFWSRAAAASQWVEREWRCALELGKKIVPTLLDSTPLPTELAEFQALRRLLDTPRASVDAQRAASARRWLPWAAGVGGVAAVTAVMWVGMLGSDDMAPSPMPAPAGDRPPVVTAPAPAPEPPTTAPSGAAPDPAAPRPTQPPYPAPAPADAPPGILQQGMLPTSPWLWGLVLVAGWVLWWRQRRRRVPREAGDFVDEVFSA